MDGEPLRGGIEGSPRDVSVEGLDGEAGVPEFGRDLVNGEAVHPVPEDARRVVGGDREPVENEPKFGVGEGLLDAAMGLGGPEGEREMRRMAGEADAALLREQGAADDLDELVNWTARNLDVAD